MKRSLETPSTLRFSQKHGEGRVLLEGQSIKLFIFSLFAWKVVSYLSLSTFFRLKCYSVVLALNFQLFGRSLASKHPVITDGRQITHISITMLLMRVARRPCNLCLVFTRLNLAFCFPNPLISLMRTLNPCSRIHNSHDDLPQPVIGERIVAPPCRDLALPQHLFSFLISIKRKSVTCCLRLLFLLKVHCLPFRFLLLLVIHSLLFLLSVLVLLSPPFFLLLPPTKTLNHLIKQL